MTSSNEKIGNAQMSEERYRASFSETVLEHLGTTPEMKAWCEAELEALWIYDELSPFEVAARAWRRGNKRLYEQALSDDARLTELAKAAGIR